MNSLAATDTSFHFCCASPYSFVVIPTKGPCLQRGKAKLVRAMGRWTLTALVINSIIGSGIFGLPDDVARLLGAAAPWAYLIGA